MRHRRVASLAATLLCAVLVGWPTPGWAPSPLPSLGRSVASEAGPALDLVAPATGSLPLPPSTEMRMEITLRPSNDAALRALDSSALHGQPRASISPSEFAERFEPSIANVSTVESYFGSYGARAFEPTPDRFGLRFTIDARGAAEALGTPLGAAADRSGAIAALRPLSLPSAVSGAIAGVGPAQIVTSPPTGRALATGEAAGPHRTPCEFLTGDGRAAGVDLFVGSDYLAAYNESPLLPDWPTRVPNASYGGGEAVATLLLSGYNVSDGTNLPPFDPAAVDRYFSDTFPSSWPKPQVVGVPVTIGGIQPPQPGPVDLANDTSLDVLENSLDLEMAGSMAPGAEVADFYLPASVIFGSTGTPDFEAVADDFAIALSTALTFNFSGRRLASVSASFGLPDLNDTLWDTELEHAAALGVTIVAASGDAGNSADSPSGRTDGPWPTWPASAAFATSGAIAVGGENLYLNGLATGSNNGSGFVHGAFDVNISGVAGQSAWSDELGGPTNYSGSEGGASLLYPQPRWQFDSAAQPSIALAGGTQGIERLGRAEPDLALSANTTLVYAGSDPSNEVEVVQGTSIAAPLFAGMVAVVDAVVGRPIGYADPALYRIASYYAAHPGPSDPFLDVTSGANALFSAAPGWDAVTGWGAVDAARLVLAYESPSVVGYSYQGPTPGLPGGASTSALPTGLAYLLPIGLLLAGVAILAVLWGRDRRMPELRVPPAPASWRPDGSPTMDCPYCGRLRPAAAVPCPSCGRL